MTPPRTRRPAGIWMEGYMSPEQQYSREAELLAWEAFGHRLRAEGRCPDRWVGVPRALPAEAAEWL
jgi:hypothetical protein